MTLYEELVEAMGKVLEKRNIPNRDDVLGHLSYRIMLSMWEYNLMEPADEEGWTEVDD